MVRVPGIAILKYVPVPWYVHVYYVRTYHGTMVRTYGAYVRSTYARTYQW
jgi:hypothetical protein